MANPSRFWPFPSGHPISVLISPASAATAKHEQEELVTQCRNASNSLTHNAGKSSGGGIGISITYNYAAQKSPRISLAADDDVAAGCWGGCDSTGIIGAAAAAAAGAAAAGGAPKALRPPLPPKLRPPNWFCIWKNRYDYDIR